MCGACWNPSEPCCDNPNPRRCPKCPGVDWSQYTYLYEQAAATRGIVIPYHTAPLWYRNQFDGTEGTPIARFAAVSTLMHYNGSCTWSAGPLRSLVPDDGVPAIEGDADLQPHLGDVRALAQWRSVAGTFRWIHPFGGTNISPSLAAVIPADFYTLDRNAWVCNGTNLWTRNDSVSPWNYPDIYPAWIRISFIEGRGIVDARQNTNQVIV